MKTKAELVALAEAKYAEAETKLKSIRDDTPDEKAQEVWDAADALRGEGDRLLARAKTVQAIEDGKRQITEPGERKVTDPQDPDDWRPAGPTEGLHREAKLERLNRADYKAAYEAYLRFGERAMARRYPNDLKTLSVGIDSAGGHLVPPDRVDEVIKKLGTPTVIRQFATIRSTTRDVVEAVYRRYVTNQQYTSAARLTWTGELPASSTTANITDPVYAMKNIPVHTALARAPVSRNLLEDAGAVIEEDVEMVLLEAFLLGEESVFITGTGAGQPRGILNHPSATVADGTEDGMEVVSGSASTLTADGLIDLGFALPEQYDVNGRFIMRKAAFSVIRKLTDGQGQYLLPDNVRNNLGPVERFLLGYPVHFSAFSEAVSADNHPIIFGDFRAYWIAERVGVSIERLDEVQAESNLVVFLGRRRVGGDVIEPYRLKTQKVSA